MRYIIFVFPFCLAKPIATDFRLIAYLIAFLKSIFYPQVYIYYRDMGEFIYSKCPKRDSQNLQGKAKPFAPLVTPKEPPQAQNF